MNVNVNKSEAEIIMAALRKYIASTRKISEEFNGVKPLDDSIRLAEKIHQNISWGLVHD